MAFDVEEVAQQPRTLLHACLASSSTPSSKVLTDFRFSPSGSFSMSWLKNRLRRLLSSRLAIIIVVRKRRSPITQRTEQLNLQTYRSGVRIFGNIAVFTYTQFDKIFVQFLSGWA